ncbi:MAG TPA: DNA polymerase I [Candidatus Bathyarchaeia archaeon]|nr:DNA polymerase I [Candidatus Bathyarchaeia archaeon]
MSDRFFIVDGPHFLYRAYHALPYLSNSKGQATHAVRGVSTMLLKLLREENPAYAAVAWDPPGPTFREAKLPTYKETRAPMPDDLRSQIALVKRVFEALRLPVLEMPGFEADDVLGTMVARMRGKPVEIVLVTGDKDMLQLVGPGVRALATNARGEPVWFDDDAVVAKWGVKPGQIPDLLALMGDSIDDIPGVPGVGEKTAVKLISQFGSVERLYENLTLVTGKVRETLASHRDQAFLSRELATVSTQVPITQDLEAFRRQEPDWERLRALWTELEFETLLRQLPAAETPVVTAEALPKLSGSAELAKWLTTVPAGDPVAVDWVGEGGPPEPAVAALGIYHPAAGPALLELGAKAPDFGGRRLVGHDIKHVIEWWLARGAPPVFEDTAVGAYLLNPARTSYKLDDVSAELLGEGSGVAAAGGRARSVWQIWGMLPRALREVGLDALYRDLEQPLVPVLATMERHGIRVDPGRLAEFSKELDLTLDRLTREIYRLAGEEFNIGSPKQMAHILFEKLKLPPVKKTKTGYSTDADVLEQLALGHELPAKIIEHRTVAKLKSTYADALPVMINATTGRIHTSFNQLVAATGRLSSAAPNLQNIPIRTELGRRIRAAFVPEPGWRFLAADYSQIELRILAHVSGEESLRAAFRAGEDIHRRTASEVFGVSLEAVTPEQRDVAKTTNFSIIYGVTAFGLSRNLAMTTKEAQEFLTRFFERHPKVKAYLERTVAEGRERGFVQTLLGRRRYIPELKSGNPNLRSFAERMATNAPVQGTAADLIKIAMVRMAKALGESGLRARMLLQVHDELLFESPEAELPRLEALARQVMESAMTLDVPLKVDIKTGADWAQA